MFNASASTFHMFMTKKLFSSLSSSIKETPTSSKDTSVTKYICFFFLQVRDTQKHKQARPHTRTVLKLSTTYRGADYGD